MHEKLYTHFIEIVKNTSWHVDIYMSIALHFYNSNLKGIPKLPNANVNLKPFKCCSKLYITNFELLGIICWIK